MSRCAPKCPQLQLRITRTNALQARCTYYAVDLKTNPYPQYRNSGPYRCGQCIEGLDVEPARVQIKTVYVETPVVVRTMPIGYDMALRYPAYLPSSWFRDRSPPRVMAQRPSPVVELCLDLEDEDE